MILYLANIVVVVSVLSILVLATRRLQRWREERSEHLQKRWVQEMQHATRHRRDFTSPWVRNISKLSEQRQAALNRLFWLLNIITTIAALVPLGFAGYNLVTNNQHQALILSLSSIAIFVVGKVGLVLLLLLGLLELVVKHIPEDIANIPGVIINLIVIRKVSEWLDERKKKKQQPPTT